MCNTNWKYSIFLLSLNNHHTNTIHFKVNQCSSSYSFSSRAITAIVEANSKSEMCHARARRQAGFCFQEKTIFLRLPKIFHHSARTKGVGLHCRGESTTLVKFKKLKLPRFACTKCIRQ